ncbi:hypothetical protein VP01_326g1 [Puccinia sorghi]|uniref:Uncharacterized protein n=1 Tax=Puccinia sorghi TaxID=27349 RepID=A0A0L6UXU3_9BASI|nr:hypothetical protein VP01_326g1 [Puccinia sorghi]
MRGKTKLDPQECTWGSSRGSLTFLILPHPHYAAPGSIRFLLKQSVYDITPFTISETISTPTSYTHGQSCRIIGLQYVVQSSMPEHPPATQVADKKLVCSVITQSINATNLHYISHQDQITGGCVFWLRKLLLERMEGNNIPAHIDTMTSLLRPMMFMLQLFSARFHKTAETIVNALKNKHIPWKVQSDIMASVSAAKTAQPSQQHSKDCPKKPRHCFLCNFPSQLDKGTGVAVMRPSQHML